MVLVPVLAMLGVAFVRFDCAKGRGLACGAAVVVVFAAFLGVRAMVPDEALFFASEAARKVRGQIRLFQKAGQGGGVLLLTGSSVATHACDSRQLQKLLRENGAGTRVVQLSAQGANHFERTFLMEAFFRGLGPGARDALLAENVRHLDEVFNAYDKDPLYLMDREQYRARAKVYLSPDYALAAWRAWRAGRAPAESFREELRASLPVASMLADRMLQNRFGVGAFSDMNLRLLDKRADAFFPLEGSKGGFDYRATADAFRGDLAGRPEKSVPAVPGWRTARDFRKARTGAWIDSEAWVGFPAIEPHRRAWQESFAGVVGGIIGPPSGGEMEAFLDAGNWYDGVHPTGRGAELSTKWLARELLREFGVRQ